MHTPKPWEAFKEDNGDFSIESSFGTVAEVFGDNCDDIEQVRDDAFVLAAAPELLEACKRAVSFMRGDHETNGIVGVDAMLGVLNAAISKAEGSR